MNLRTYIKNSIAICLISVAIALPFPYYLIGSVFDTSSDSILMYWVVFFTLIGSFLVAGIFRETIARSRFGIYSGIILSYVLAFFLLKYGIDKLLLQQFYLPQPNTLFTQVGDLTKDILFWTSMGTSKSYNWFMGGIEIFPGLLLLYSKTREVGAILAFGVLLNVFMINVGFDISVKLLSLYLLICSVFLIQPFALRLYQFFILKQSAQLAEEKKPLSNSPRIQRIVKVGIIFLFALEIGLPYLNQPSVQNEHIGAYQLETPTLLFGQLVKRMYIHKEGYLIIENSDGEFTDYKSTTTGNYIYLTSKKVGFQIHQNASNTEFRMMGESANKPIRTTRINLDELPLLQDDFHWTVEGILSSN